jgi:hypothetical protein
LFFYIFYFIFYLIILVFVCFYLFGFGYYVLSVVGVGVEMVFLNYPKINLAPAFNHNDARTKTNECLNPSLIFPSESFPITSPAKNP